MLGTLMECGMLRCAGTFLFIDDRPGCCDWAAKVMLFDLTEMRR